MRKGLSAVFGLLLLGICLTGTSMTAHAQQMAGYHERVTTETEAEDTWYAVQRGVYLGYGRSKVMQAGTRKVSISGSTVATQIVDELRLGLYLDESSDNVSYGTVGVYHFTATDDTSVSGGEANIRATSGYYYAARGVHRVTEGSVTETSDSSTNAIIAQ